MFEYYGSKGSNVDEYPPPAYNRVIEPFCGSARYACKYHDRDVWLNDKYDAVYKAWKWFTQASIADVKSLPELKHGETLDSYQQLSEGERAILGYCIGSTGKRPYLRCSAWGERDIVRTKARLLTMVGKMSHWKITNLDVYDMPNELGTWYVDPPYEVGGEDYVHSTIDFAKLSDWCGRRRGQLIVCENGNQTWLPEFEIVSTTFNKSPQLGANREVNFEVMWHKPGDPMADAIAAHSSFVDGIHPVCAMVPDQTPQEFAALVGSIKRNGLRHPIVVDGNLLILDGRHRLRACFETGTEARFATSDAEPTEYVKDAITHRNLTAGQRAMIANDIRDWYDERAKERMLAGKADPRVNVPGGEFRSREEAGKAVGVGGSYVDRARDVANSSAELAQAVRDGDLSLNAAHNILKAKTEVVLQQPTNRADSLLNTLKYRGNGLRTAMDTYIEHVETVLSDADCMARPDIAAKLEAATGGIEARQKELADLLGKVARHVQANQLH